MRLSDSSRSAPVARAPLSIAVSIAVSITLLASCAVGPDYARPTMEVPAAFKESGPWKTAEPQRVPTGRLWWGAFDDVTLDGLMTDADNANQSIRVSEAQYRQALAVSAQARAAYFPSVGANAGVNRGLTNSTGVKLINDVNLGLSASWQPDFWGSVRRSVEAGDASAQGSGDDLAGARLSVQSLLAQDYFQLRVIDLLRDQYAATTEAYARALQLAQSQYKAGVALRSDVALAQSQLKTAQAQAVDLEATRNQFEHAIAILTGRAPAAFTLAPVKTTLAELQARLPVIPTGVPSALLERRPDIAGAERRVAAANANIGVAQAAFYPSLTLSASGGVNGASLSNLFDTPGRVWSLGAALAQTIFDGGLRRARTDQAVAVYDATVAQYKGTVLTGFQQVEDNLSTLRVLDQESALQAEAVAAAQIAERSALSQYRAGTATYISVVTAQTLSLTNQRTATQLMSRQLVASVNLIVAIGGGWSTADAVSTTGAAGATAAADVHTIHTPAPVALAQPFTSPTP